MRNVFANSYPVFANAVKQSRGSEYTLWIASLRSQRRKILFISLFLIHITGHTNTLYPLDTPKQDAQFTHLLRELRCLVCQNQDLADSNAGLAKDLRNEVYQLVKDGKSDDEIVHYLTARYGDFILFKPPVKAVTAMLWFGPALFMLLGILIFWRTCFRRNCNE